MIHFSLFSGIGGFDLASEWMGWKNYLSCEINEFGNKILEYYWADAYHHRDIHTLTYETIDIELSRRFGSDWRNDDIIITGGFPCQPYSMAGKRLGKEDERHLFPEMLRIIREVQPKWIVGENVLGIVNWSGGLVFEEVQADLEAQGYEVQSYVLPACAVNAPHRRDRVWFVAYSNGTGKKHNGGTNIAEEREIRGDEKSNVLAELCGDGNASDPDSDWLRQEHKLCTRGNLPEEWTDESRTPPDTESQSGKWVRPEQREFSESEQGQFRGTCGEMGNTTGNWQNFPTQSPICNGNDGLSSRLDSITFPKWRNESIKGGGNAIVPQVCIQIFKSIEQYELSQQSPDPMG
jgi:DNA (cytosine-5)-methyltransferase 1